MISGPPVHRDPRSEHFFEAAARDQLAVRRCGECGHLHEPESRTCHSCGSATLGWTMVSGAAKLVSWAVVHHPPHPAFADQVPFPIGLVELAEGPWVHARVVDVPLENLRAGLPLAVAFVHPDDGDSYPVFTTGEQS
ncbi:MAG TPA: OB-fold domain-containing protein [Nocardioidaceae bacterium]|nr:OB-fold domain-containing protein [Nocardioidaceae bacterium]